MLPDLKNFHQPWWEKGEFFGLTWNQVILIGIGLGLALFYVFGLNGDWVFGLRP
jgi:hypothetical protein